MRDHFHCKPVSRTPLAAQTALQVKLDNALTILENTTPVITNLLTWVTGGISTVGTGVIGFFESAALAVRGTPWKM